MIDMAKRRKKETESKSKILWPSYFRFHVDQYYMAHTTEERMLCCSRSKSSLLFSPVCQGDDSKAQITGVVSPLGKSSHVSLRKQHRQSSKWHKCKDVQICYLVFTTKAQKSALSQIHTYTITLHRHLFQSLNLGDPLTSHWQIHTHTHPANWKFLMFYYSFNHYYCHSSLSDPNYCFIKGRHSWRIKLLSL